MPWELAVLCVLAAAAISAATTVVVGRGARRRGFVDRPGGHKGHQGEIALGGGIAIVAAVVLPILGVLIAAQLWFRRDLSGLPGLVQTHLGGVISKSREGTGIIGGAIVLHILGLVDDIRPLRAGIKFVVQFFVAGVLAVVFDLRVLSHLGYAVSIGVTVLWIVTIVNAFNFLDNMDGLSAGVGIIVAAVYAGVAARAGQVFVPACCLLLVGALAGFLPFNFQPASVFLGDAGSTVVGYLIAVFTILTTFYNPAHGQQPIGVVAPLIVLAVPLYDTASVILRRWRAGRPIWVGDRHHYSHRLVRGGMTVRRAVAAIWLATLATALPAVMLPTATWAEGVGVLAETVTVVALIAVLEGSGGDDDAKR